VSFFIEIEWVESKTTEKKRQKKKIEKKVLEKDVLAIETFRPIQRRHINIYIFSKTRKKVIR